eukprot:COSAG02_NODE_3877_length_6101_cov_2.939020_4_plen_89_part_00
MDTSCSARRASRRAGAVVGGREGRTSHQEVLTRCSCCTTGRVKGMEIPEIEDEDEVKSMISAAELVRVLSRRRYNHPFVVWSGLVWSR